MIVRIQDGTSQDHPYIRGEYSLAIKSPLIIPGSSLHTWGIRRTGRWPKKRSRIIPTYVGNTCAFTPTSRQTKDHPYIRGEYVGSRVIVNGRLGSSLHTWGIQSLPRAIQILFGIIPTYVGNTSTISLIKPESKDHPYIRGEYTVLPSINK